MSGHEALHFVTGSASMTSTTSWTAKSQRRAEARRRAQQRASEEFDIAPSSTSTYLAESSCRVSVCGQQHSRLMCPDWLGPLDTAKPTANVTLDGAQICKRFNDNRKCLAEGSFRCQGKHVCDWLLPASPSDLRRRLKEKQLAITTLERQLQATSDQQSPSDLNWRQQILNDMSGESQLSVRTPVVNLHASLRHEVEPAPPLYPIEGPQRESTIGSSSLGHNRRIVRSALHIRVIKSILKNGSQKSRRRNMLTNILFGNTKPTANTTLAGDSICKRYNDTRTCIAVGSEGCSGKHVCDWIILATGHVCGQQHPRWSCPCVTFVFDAANESIYNILVGQPHDYVKKRSYM